MKIIARNLLVIIFGILDCEAVWLGFIEFLMLYSKSKSLNYALVFAEYGSSSS